MRAGDHPHRFWTPSLAYCFGLRPADMADLTFEQLDAANKFIAELNEAGR